MRRILSLGVARRARGLLGRRRDKQPRSSRSRHRSPATRPSSSCRRSRPRSRSRRARRPTATRPTSGRRSSTSSRPRTSARWRRSSKTTDPAYYLAYQLVEQRIVSLEAEGGALVTDSDDTARNLDVEVRVGSPKLDNTRQLVRRHQRAQRAAHPPRPRAVRRRQAGARRTRCGSRPIAATTRRCRALGYVTPGPVDAVSKQRATTPDFSAEPAEVYVEAPAKLEFDKAQWVERLKRCSAKALNGRTATRGTCGVVFQLNTSYFVNSEGSADPAVVDERAAVGVGRRQGRRRHEPVAARAAVRPHAGGSARRRRGRQDDQDGHRRSRRAARRAARRAVRRPGDPRGPRRRRVLPRGVRPPHRGPPPEGPDERPDVRELRRQGHRARLARRSTTTRSSSRSTASSSTASTASTTRACARITCR